MATSVDSADQCLLSFIRRDYARCAELAATLLPKTTLLNVLLLLISLQRLGQNALLEYYGGQCLFGIKNLPWEHALLRLTLGQGQPETVVSSATNDSDRWLAHFIAGCRFITESKTLSARQQFDICLANADDHVSKALVISQRDAPPPNPDSPDNQVTDLAWRYRQLREEKRHDEAVIVAQKALDILSRYLPDNRGQIAGMLGNLAEAYTSLGNYSGAEPLWRQSLMIWEEILGERHIELTRSLRGLARVYNALGLPSESAVFAKRESDLCRDILGEDHPESIQSLVYLIDIYRQLAEHSQAETLCLRVVDSVRKQLGESDEQYAASLSLLARIRLDRRDPVAALPVLEELLDLRRATLGRDQRAFISTAQILADTYCALHHYAKAATIASEIAELFRTTLGADHPDYASSLTYLASIHSATHNHGAAVPLLQEVVAIQRKRTGTDHPDYAAALTKLAAACYKDRKVALAEQLFREALETYRRHIQHSDERIMLTLGNLATICVDQGKDEEALPLLLEAKEGLLKSQSGTHPNVAMCLYTLATLFLRRGDNEQAERYLTQAVDIVRQAYGDDHPELSEMLPALASICCLNGNPGRALELLLKSASITERTMRDVLSLSSERKQLTFLIRAQTDIDLLVTLVTRLLADSSDAVKAVYSLVLSRKGIVSEALSARQRALKNADGPSLQDKRSELNALRSRIASFQRNGPSVGREAAETYLKTERPWLSALEINTLITKMDDVDLKKVALQAAYAEVSQCREWRSRVDELETEIMTAMGSTGRTAFLESIDLRRFFESLPSESTVVDFVVYNQTDFRAFALKSQRAVFVPRYACFVVRAGTAEVRIVDLGDLEMINGLVAAYRKALGNGENDSGASDSYKKSLLEKGRGLSEGAALRSCVFDPLESLLADSHRMIVVPDGELAVIPFEVLPQDDGSYLVDDYQISYMSAGRESLRFGLTGRAEKEPAVVIGNPDFDLAGQDDYLRRGSVNLAGTGVRSPEAGVSFVQSRQSDDVFRDALRFRRLPGTEVEVNMIADLLGVKPWVGSAAVKSRVRALKSPRILHVASHGFFLENVTYAMSDEVYVYISSKDSIRGRLEGIRVESPLLRSGIALAGANAWLSGGSTSNEAEDGILTAEDVTTLDLTETDLVVLSACETGLGELTKGQGVLGMRHAFSFAGAKTLVMSLWKVPDLATALLMELFYENLLVRRHGRCEALRNAQVELRHLTLGKLRAKWLSTKMLDRLAENPEIEKALKVLSQRPSEYLPFQHPRAWGAFICLGDPSPIPDHPKAAN